MKKFFTEHYIPIFILSSVALLTVSFPLRLQALEPYVYAAGIEKYYNFSSMFSLAAGYQLPDFGRYHPNHPIGQALAGLAFDYLGISALTWMRAINAIAALCTGYFLYFLCLALRLEKFIASTALALFHATHFAALATFSGEWHIPALAFNIAGAYRLVFYFEENKARHLYTAAGLMAMGSCYHLNASFMLICFGVMLLCVRPLWRYPKEIGISAIIVTVPIIVVYFLIPMFLFDLSSARKFLDFFLVYTKLHATPYKGMDWFGMAITTFCHGFVFIFPGMKFTLASILTFMVLFSATIFSFARTSVISPFRWLLVALPFAWLIGPRLISSRPDALNGWLFCVPYLCIIIVAGAYHWNMRLRYPLILLVFGTFVWNFSHWIYPNASRSQREMFFFQLPESEPKTTPIAFIIHQPPFSFPELWHAGSVLGFRKQSTFFPCCGEKNYLDNLAEWIKSNPNGIIVSDNNFSQLEHFFKEVKNNYRRIVDQTADWPGSLTPATVFIPLKNPLQLRKHLVIWKPFKAE